MEKGLGHPTTRLGYKLNKCNYCFLTIDSYKTPKQHIRKLLKRYDQGSDTPLYKTQRDHKSG